MLRARNTCVGLMALLLGAGVAVLRAQSKPGVRSFEIVRKRMDVDVDGAPRAYGPPGFKTLDTPLDAHYRAQKDGPIVGYMTEHGKPIVQGSQDPAPGYYVSQTALEDETKGERDPRRYVDATKINYVVLGDVARKRGVKIGDFVAVHSKRTRRSVYGIVGDDGNPSGDEGSLHLLQALGYPFHDGRNESVEDEDVVVRYFLRSNSQHLFFHEQSMLDAAARKLGLSCDFGMGSASKR